MMRGCSAPILANLSATLRHFKINFEKLKVLIDHSRNMKFI